MSNRDKNISRRKFFSLIGNGAIFTAISGFAIVLYKYLFPNVLYEPSPIFKAGHIENFPVGTAILLKERKIFLFRDSKGFYSISAVCPHLGCLVNRPPQGGFFCPCHGSVFDAQGKVIKGPATRNLGAFRVSASRGGQIQIDLSNKVDDTYRFKA